MYGVVSAWHSFLRLVLPPPLMRPAAPPALLPSAVQHEKIAQLRDILEPRWYPFFAQYVVCKRASIETNYHAVCAGAVVFGVGLAPVMCRCPHSKQKAMR